MEKKLFSNLDNTLLVEIFPNFGSNESKYLIGPSRENICSIVIGKSK